MKTHPLLGWLCSPIPMRLIPGLAVLLATTAAALDYPALVASAGPERAARFEVFRTFQIKGICGTARLDLAAQYGANTLRTYVPPTRAELDEYQRLGFKVIVGIWMPHQGENAGKGAKWNYDYQENGDEQLKAFSETIDRIGDHPTILMWCLGNEVHLEPAYLRTVNRMSKLVHEKHPRQLTSLTMVNAPKEKVALIKTHAPDLDVLGYNSYGQGAVAGASKNLEAEWGRAYYVSEFGPQGPWWGRKTAWGEVYEQSYDAKLSDLRQSFARIDAAPHCLGSTMFLWGSWSEQKPTYFSALLSPRGDKRAANDQELLITPMAEEFCHYWSGSYPPQRGPVLTKLTLCNQTNATDAVVAAGEKFAVRASATDADTSPDQLKYRWWILDGRGQAVVGPVDSEQPHTELLAPDAPGEHFFVMAFVIAPDKRASGFTVPLKVKGDGQTAAHQPAD